ncbi:MAG: hypothetical protein JNL64_07070 [Blastocatellia bacterium]|nr:hypothetical protein [Blastocatellia bacterium]
MRKRVLLVCLTVIAAACSNAPISSNAQPTAQAQQYVWTKVVDEGPWRKNYNFQMFVIDGKLMALHPDGTWMSKDGKAWEKSPLKNVINNQAFLDYVFFKGSLYGLGYLEGNIERFTFKPEIYRTTDFKKWDTISKNSNLPRRFFYRPFVFKENIWIVGGEDRQTQFADVWNSPDGITWKKQVENAAFGKRSGSQVVELNGKLFLLNNDVWSSTDGINWQRETSEIVKGEEIFGYTAVVFDQKIWLLGCNRNGRFSSQVLVSKDGKNWEGKNAPWTPRGGIAATVFNSALYMTGGKYGGTPDHVDFVYSNDVWAMERQ